MVFAQAGNIDIMGRHSVSLIIGRPGCYHIAGNSVHAARIMTIIRAPTATKLPENARTAVLVTGSHGGVYPGRLAALAGVRAAIFHDAGIGRDDAGIGALALLQNLGIAAATVSHQTARIGDTDDMMARGRISRVNATAAQAGVTEGMRCADAAARLQTAPATHAVPPQLAEGRTVERPEAAIRGLVLIDSASMVLPDDVDAVIVTGSHGGLVGGDPAMALRVPGFAAAFNDAGIGVDNAGLGRLAALDLRRIAAITVAAHSARIGDARSTLTDGLISAANQTAHRLGARTGTPAQPLLLAWLHLPA